MNVMRERKAVMGRLCRNVRNGDEGEQREKKPHL